jgi:phospholipase/carboxylesterase
VVAVVAVLAAGCGDEQGFLVDGSFGSARLSVRPSAPEELSMVKGVIPLSDSSERGVLYVPDSYQPGTPAPLVVLFHGAGDNSQRMLELVRTSADAAGALVLAPQSQKETWDLLIGKYGPDVSALDERLRQVFREYSVDASRVGISGFSDGASYALSVGLTNGDLFPHITAFSAGFVAASELNGKPSVYLSHGTKDAVLPIETCGRYIEYQLQDQKYPVRFHEFDGPHTVPADIAAEGFAFATGAQ